jgi:hypothetical protein
MKTLFNFFVIAVLSMGALSCTKSSSTSTIVTPPPPNTDPFIYSRINRNIVQPVTMQLGTTSSILHIGDVVTIFLPYSSTNEEFVSTTITMADGSTDLPINTYSLVSSADASASGLTLPDDMLDQHNFFFVTFVIDETYLGKSVSLKSKLEGQITTSTDALAGAFSVVQ